MGDADLPEAWAGFESRWLANSDLGGSLGAAIELLIPPGEGYEVHRLGGNERVVYIYDGEGVHLGSGGELEVETDDVLVLTPDAWHGFENRGTEPARIWVAWAPSPDLASTSWERPDGEVDGAAPTKRKLRGAGEDPSRTPQDQGFRDLGISWDGAKGAESITLGWAHFETKGLHQMHRHNNADEVLHVATGSGMHLTPDREVEMVGPSYDFAPAGEWHQMTVTSPRMEGMFFYFGGADLEGTGYELQSEPGVAATSGG